MVAWQRRIMGAAMGMSARERAFNNRVVNPVMTALITHGFGLPTYAVVETTGRKSGRKRLAPVASGLDGDTFWMISGRGDKASYVYNIRANPRVRVIARPARLRDGLRTRSRTGTAHLMPGDDAHARHRRLGQGRPLYRLDGFILRRLADGGDMLTIRIDLD
jgi:deazaflavin-dependent oxidoreductase (nitroreductase family)